MPVRMKQSDETRVSTTTLTDDAELTISLSGSSIYFIEGCVLFASGAVPDIKCTFGYSGTLTDALLQFFGCQANDNRLNGAAQTPRAFPCNAAFLTGPTTVAIAGSDTANTAGLAYIRGVVRTNSSGTLKVQWAQNNLDAGNTTVMAGSYLRYTLQADMPGTLIVKTAAESRTNTTTYTADSDLLFPVEANKSYIAELLFNQTSSTTPDFKHQMTDVTIDAACGFSNRLANNTFNTQPSSAIGGLAGSWQSNLFTTPFEIVMNTFGRQLAVWGMIQGASNDTVALEWAQVNLSALAAMMNTPSYIWFQEVTT